MVSVRVDELNSLGGSTLEVGEGDHLLVDWCNELVVSSGFDDLVGSSAKSSL